jgi:hypothetical protein
MTTPTAIQTVLTEWEPIYRTDVDRGVLDVSACILGTRTMIAAFTHLGIEATAVPTRAVACNRVGAEMLRSGLPSSQWPSHAWTVGTDTSPVEGRYSGHMVAVVCIDGEEWLVDSTSLQFRRPQRDMPIPATLSLNADGWDTNWLVARHRQWEVAWLRAPELGLRHRQSPDWRRNWKPYAERLIGRLDRVVV